jgi:putative PIN family toxin of toxin-antitoxin system
MIRVVLDTNIIVSALFQPLDPSAQIFVMSLGGAVQLCVGGNVYAEYEEVISRPRLKRSQEIIAATLQAIREKGLRVRPVEKVRACLDPDDDIFPGMRPGCPRRLCGDRKSQGLSPVTGGDANRNAAVVAR